MQWSLAPLSISLPKNCIREVECVDVYIQIVRLLRKKFVLGMAELENDKIDDKENTVS